MLGGATKAVIAKGASRVPGLKRLPIYKVIAIGEVALLARSHAVRLDRDERRRLAALIRKGRGRASRLTEPDRDELRELVAKTEPRLFVGLAADALSPLPLPRRLVRGPRRKRP